MREKIFIPMATLIAPSDQGGYEMSTISDTLLETLEAVDLDPRLASGVMSEKAQDRLYDECDGVLIGGGSNLGKDEKRDTMTLRILQKTRRDGKPTLGICLGAETIAVAAGGTLIPDISKVTTEKHGVSIDEYDPSHTSSTYHKVDIQQQTKAHIIFQEGIILVPSRHEQGIADSGDLEISGRSPAGITEIVEHPGLPFHIGVLFHPELEKTPLMDRLFIAYKHATSDFKHARTIFRSKNQEFPFAS